MLAMLRFGRRLLGGNRRRVQQSSEPSPTSGEAAPSCTKRRIGVNVTMRVYAEEFRNVTERNAAVLTRTAERGFGT